MKNYMVTLNDDKEIIHNLIKNVTNIIRKQFKDEINNKKIIIHNNSLKLLLLL